MAPIRVSGMAEDPVPDDALARRIFARHVRIARTGVFHALLALPLPKGFDEHLLLRHLRPLPRRDGAAEFGRLRVRLDPELVIRLHPLPLHLACFRACAAARPLPDAQQGSILGSWLAITQAGLSPTKVRGIAEPHCPRNSAGIPRQASIPRSICARRFSPSSSTSTPPWPNPSGGLTTESRSSHDVGAISAQQYSSTYLPGHRVPDRRGLELGLIAATLGVGSSGHLGAVGPNAIGEMPRLPAGPAFRAVTVDCLVRSNR